MGGVLIAHLPLQRHVPQILRELLLLHNHPLHPHQLAVQVLEELVSGHAEDHGVEVED